MALNSSIGELARALSWEDVESVLLMRPAEILVRLFAGWTEPEVRFRGICNY
jgi:hypothetical protein